MERYFICGEVLAAVALEVDSFRRVGGVCGNDFSDGNLAGVEMILADDAAGLNAGVEVEDGFDFLGKNLHSGDVDDGLASPDEREQSIRAADDEVAAGEVSVLERVGVPWDEIGVEQAGASDVELAGLAIGDGISGGVKNGDFIGG